MPPSKSTNTIKSKGEVKGKVEVKGKSNIKSKSAVTPKGSDNVTVRKSKTTTPKKKSESGETVNASRQDSPRVSTNELELSTAATAEAEELTRKMKELVSGGRTPLKASPSTLEMWSQAEKETKENKPYVMSVSEKKPSISYDKRRESPEVLESGVVGGENTDDKKTICVDKVDSNEVERTEDIDVEESGQTVDTNNSVEEQQQPVSLTLPSSSPTSSLSKGKNTSSDGDSEKLVYKENPVVKASSRPDNVLEVETTDVGYDDDDNNNGDVDSRKAKTGKSSKRDSTIWTSSNKTKHLGKNFNEIMGLVPVTPRPTDLITLTILIGIPVFLFVFFFSALGYGIAVFRFLSNHPDLGAYGFIMAFFIGA
jgi:hypothetical protein